MHLILFYLLHFFIIYEKKVAFIIDLIKTNSTVTLQNATINNELLVSNSVTFNTTTSPTIQLKFNKALNKNSVANTISITEISGTVIPLNMRYLNGDSTITISPNTALKNFKKYNLTISKSLLSISKENLNSDYEYFFVTQMDSSDKFPILTDNALLDTVQKYSFNYFWKFGHPTSGLSRERNTSGDIVTSGGSGFGIMTIPVAISRKFITRSEGLNRLRMIVDFLTNKAIKFHGAFPHWLNGNTGKVVPFSPKDDGADLVETSYLMAGLLTARQYFNGTNIEEQSIRNDINILWNGVDWNWFRNNQNTLYWHWSPKYNWDMNMKIQGWNECLITYIMGSSAANPIPTSAYTEGFTRNGLIQNNTTFFNYLLPLGPAMGGPLFWAQYSFLGINPFGLSDNTTNYQTQVMNHSKINYTYCKANPKGYFGYSEQCWGLTASDIQNGYSASSPSNDLGVIAPTAALSSMPFTPVESMKALKYFYYKLGDKIWNQYGFVDAFSLKDQWFATSQLAIDQGPIIIMIENYRTGLVWDLLSSCPEVKTGLKRLGFKAPYL